MTSEDSPIIDFYPNNFKSDLNGKQQEWEAVVLIPFIDEGRLLVAMKSRNHLLSEDEVRRNRHSGHLKFTTKQKPSGNFKAPAFFPEIILTKSKRFYKFILNLYMLQKLAKLNQELQLL